MRVYLGRTYSGVYKNVYTIMGSFYVRENGENGIIKNE